MKKLLFSKRFLWGLGLLLVLAACRLPWLSCDAGVPALWDYGYFCTDEGFYTLEGRYLYLTGSVFDPLLLGSGTLIYATLQHLLCFLSYECFGLNHWAHRVPVLVVSISAWMGVYIFLSRRTAVWLAGLVVGIVSCNPISLVYERTASTDILMGGLVVWAYFFAWRRSLWNVVICAAFLALAYNAKVSSLGIFPLIGLTVLAARERRWSRGLLFATSVIVFVVGTRWVLNSYIGHLALLEGMAPDEMMRLIGRGGGIPEVPELFSVLKSYSSLPRWTTAGVLGVGLVVALVIPFLVLVGRLFRKGARWDRCVALCLGIIIYIAAVDVGRGGFYVRHYAPLFYFIPILIFLIRKDMPAIGNISWRRGVCFMGIAFLAFEAIFWLTPLGCPDPRLLIPYYCNHHNPPAANLWAITWRMIVPITVALCFVVWSFQKWSAQPWRKWVVALGVCLVIAHFGSTGWPLFRFGFMDALAKENIVPLVLLHVLLVAAGSLWLLHWRGMRRGKVWYICFIMAFVASWVINPYWRMGTVQLATRKWDRQNIAQSLEQFMPQNAVVIGERSMSLLLGTRLNTGSLARLPDDEMIDRIERLTRSNKAAFVVLDKLENKQWQVLAKNASRIQCKVVATILLPAHHNGEPIECYIARLECMKK